MATLQVPGSGPNGDATPASPVSPARTDATAMTTRTNATAGIGANERGRRRRRAPQAYKWDDNVLGRRARQCAIAAALKLKDSHEGLHKRNLEELPIIAHPEWKFHHGTVMYLHRPDKLAEVAAGLQQLKADREKARTEAPSSPRSPGRQRAPTSPRTPATNRSTTPLKTVIWEELEQFRQIVSQQGERYEETEQDVQAWNVEKQAFNTPTAQEWKLIESFWRECNLKYGSLAKAFKSFDLNSNGSLSCIEFQQSCETNRFSLSSEEQAQVFRLLDGSCRGDVNKDEFAGSRLLRETDKVDDDGAKKAAEEKKHKDYVESLKKRQTKVQIDGDVSDPETFWRFLREFFPEKSPGLSYARAFRQIDINRNGSLSQSEFVAGLQSLKYPGERWQWKKLFFLMDDDQDGEIAIGEFSNWEAPETRELTASGRSTASTMAGARYQKALKQLSSTLQKQNTISDEAVTKHTAMSHTPKLGEYDEKLHEQRYQKRDAWVLPGAEDGWTRIYGTVLAMKRPDRCQRIRDGLEKMAADRVAATAPTRSWYSRPISPDRTRPPATGADRPVPSMAVFRYSPIMKFPELPMCSMLEHSASEDLSVWRRQTYD